MKKSLRTMTLAIVFLVVLQSGCAPAATPAPPTVAPSPTSIPSPIPPTFTPEPTATATLIPSPTPLPGSLVLPVDTLDNTIPWLPLDSSARPGTYYFSFNLSKPPFNSVLVRQAFVAAIDREALVEVAEKYGQKNPRPATSLTPPETLGRDLYNQVGIPFNPDHAKELLEQAGYTEGSNFPPVTLLTNMTGDPAPGAHVKIADAMVEMWQQYLGIQVTVKVMRWESYAESIDTNPPEIFRVGWAADFNDPDNFLRELFVSESQYNYGNFSTPEFDELVDRAAELNDPAERQELYIQAERILCESEAALIPIYHCTH
jgi:oligopeptide transport system substrate-binding protein